MEFIPDYRESRLYGFCPRARAEPSSAKKFTFTEAAPLALIKMNCVAKPPPSAICGKTIGDGADWFSSATGKVVRSVSPRELTSERSVRATKGVDASEVISTTP